jgi:hypothetical protein
VEFQFSGQQIENYWNCIINGLLRLIKLGRPHGDVNKFNILFNNKTNKFKLIDFEVDLYRELNFYHTQDLLKAFKCMLLFPNIQDILKVYVEGICERIRFFYDMGAHQSKIVAFVKSKEAGFRIICFRLREDENAVTRSMMHKGNINFNMMERRFLGKGKNLQTFSSKSSNNNRGTTSLPSSTAYENYINTFLPLDQSRESVDVLKII